jgi:hypothetical protein
MMETTGFQSNILNIEKIEASLTLKRSNDEKVRQIIDAISKKNLTEIDKEIMIAILETCKCHEYTENRLVDYERFTLYKRRVIKNSHVKEDNQ